MKSRFVLQNLIGKSRQFGCLSIRSIQERIVYCAVQVHASIFEYFLELYRVKLRRVSVGGGFLKADALLK
jgi:hypothetical protein